MKNTVQLPSTHTALLAAFRTYLASLGLSSISRKLYSADIARLLASSLFNDLNVATLTNPKNYASYLSQPELTNSSTLLRRTLASLRQFGTFLNQSFDLPSPIANLSLASNTLSNTISTSSSKYIKACMEYLKDNHLTDSSIRSYKSDITQYLIYLESHHPSTQIESLLTDKNLQNYTDLLTHLDTQSPATIERKIKTIRRFLNWYSSTKLQVVVSDNTKIPASSLHPSSLSSSVQVNGDNSAHAETYSDQPQTQLPDHKHNNVKKSNYRKLRLPTFRTLLSGVILLVLISTLSIFSYRQFGRDASLTAAFPSTPVTPNRQLSFQGRLENASGTPITAATNFVFKLHDASSGGSELYSSGTCSITPDTDGVFSTQIGGTCGAGIASSVFTENADVWLEVTVGAETLTPRQQIATVAYALNSETIQGFPISATVSAIRNTVVPMNQWGEIIVGEQSPRLTGVSGTFQISAPSLSLVTATGTNGNITLAPDGTGQVNINGNTTTTNFFNVSNAQLTTGSLITGTAANNNTGFKLLDLLSGASPTSKFSIDAVGNTYISGALGIGTVGPDAKTDILATSGEQLRLTYTDGAAYTGFTVDSGGDLIIDASGNDISLGATDTFSVYGSLEGQGQVNLGDGGDTITLNGSSITLAGFDCTSNTNGGALTTDGSGVLQCSDDDSGGAGGGSNWRINSGAISPNNDTLDLLIGNTATSSAKAGFIYINSGTPTATVSAGVAGGSYLTATGTLATTANQSLTLGNSTTGNVVIAPGGTPALTATGANLVAAGNLTLTAATNLIFGSTSLGETTSAVDSGAYLVGTFDEFANSNSLNVQDVLDDLDNSLTTALAGSTVWTDAGTYLYPTAAEVLGNSASGGANKLAGIYLADSSPLTFGTDNDFSFAFNNATSTLGSTLTSGTRLGINTTSALATLDVRSSLGTIPTASISGNTSMATLIVDQSGSGDIFTASSAGQTRFVVKNNGNVGIDVSDPTNKLEIGGSTSTISNDSGDITLDSASDSISFAGDSLINLLNLYSSGELGVGVADAIGRFHVHGATTGKALAILNELGDQDILTASASGTTRFRLTNNGSLSLDGDYLNFALTDGTSGYGFRDNGGTLQFKHNGGSWADVGSGGASWWDQVNGTIQPYNKTVDFLLGGTATSSAKFAVLNMNSGTPTASISGNMIIGQGDYLGSEYGPLNLAYKSGANAWTNGLILQDTTGNVGIGVSNPTQKLEVNGYIVGQRFEDSASSAYFIDPAATGTSVSIDGNIVGNGAFYLSTGSDAIAVSIGTTGAGKLDAGTIDPPYTINGEKFATYMTSMTGVKEETTGTVATSEYISGKGYRATLDFAGSLTGSDLWLFSKTTSLQSQLDKLVVLTTAAGNSKTWYELDAELGKLYLFSTNPTLISYRLTAPRFDANNWENTRDSDSIGFVINSPSTWSVPSEIASLYSSISETIQETITNTLSTSLISPLASSSAIVITSNPSSEPSTLPSGNDYLNSDPLLIVDGTLDVATISARTAYLNDVVAETITARDIVADTITANTIIGLDAKIASLSGITDSDIDSITDRIKDRLNSLTDPATAEDLPIPSEAMGSAESNRELNIFSLDASGSATLSSADIDFATINQYLAVIGNATITTLDVTNGIYTSDLGSKTGLLALQPLGGIVNIASNTMIVDSLTGTVSINGNLVVSGTVLADKASLNQLEIGTPSEASGSALGKLLSVYNESGRAVATIDASGSANLASLTTNMITIASSGTASDSSALSNLIGSTQSNATAGVATLNSPNTELTISSPYVTGNSLVYLTPTTNTDNKVLFIQSKITCPATVLAIDPNCAPSFTVGIDSPASSDISFNWWIIELSPTQPINNSESEQTL